MVRLELDAERCDILDRALTGLAKSLQAARDMAVITHETFCQARAVQYQLKVLASMGRTAFNENQHGRELDEEGFGRATNVAKMLLASDSTSATFSLA